MSVELKVVLVGDDQDQQSAFNNPTSDRPTSIPPVVPTSPILAPPIVNSVPVAPPIQSDDAPTVEPPRSISTPSREQGEIPRRGDDLIDSIEALIGAIDELTRVQTGEKRQAPGTAREPAQPSNAFERFAQTVRQRIDDLGLSHTAVGNMVANLTNLVASAGSRVMSAASSVAGPIAGGVSKTAATATEATATATAAEAGASSAGAGAAAGLGAVAMPLVVVASAAAASALSLQQFMEAVKRAAFELEDLSPQIAAVRAQQEVTMELARLDRARRIGGDVASLEAARSRINESMYEIQTKIYEYVAKFAPVLELAADGVNAIARTVLAAEASVALGVARLTPNPNDDKPAKEAYDNAIKEMNAAILELATSGPPKASGRDPFFDEFLFGRADQKPPNGMGANNP